MSMHRCIDIPMYLSVVFRGHSRRPGPLSDTARLCGISCAAPPTWQTAPCGLTDTVAPRRSPAASAGARACLSAHLLSSCFPLSERSLQSDNVRGLDDNILDNIVAVVYVSSVQRTGERGTADVHHHKHPQR